MPHHRLIFPDPSDLPIEQTPTAEIDSGDKVLIWLKNTA
jgi:hypothetical protein